MSATAFYLVQYKKSGLTGSKSIAHTHFGSSLIYTMCGINTTFTTLQIIEEIPIEEKTMEDLVEFYEENQDTSLHLIEESLGDILDEWMGREGLYICRGCLASIRKLVKGRSYHMSKKRTNKPVDLVLAATAASMMTQGTLHIRTKPYLDRANNPEWLTSMLGTATLLPHTEVSSLCHGFPYRKPYEASKTFSTNDLKNFKRPGRYISEKDIKNLEEQIRSMDLNASPDRPICKTCLKRLCCILRDHYPREKEIKEEYMPEESSPVRTDSENYTAVDIPRLTAASIFGVLVFPNRDDAEELEGEWSEVIRYFLERNPWQGGFITMGRTAEEAIQRLLDGKDSDDEREEMMQALKEGRVYVFELVPRGYTFSVKETKRYSVEAVRAFMG